MSKEWVVERIRFGDTKHIRAVAEVSKAGCFLCRLILEDLEVNGALTDYPWDFNEKTTFPRNGKLLHLELEAGSLDSGSAGSV